MPLKAHYRCLIPSDAEALVLLWRRTGALVLTQDDTPSALRGYFLRNPGVSQGAFVEDRLVGAIIGGHDGRRGYPKHIAVEPEFKHNGIGRVLMYRCLNDLSRQGILTAHYSVLNSNVAALDFFSSILVHPSLDWSEVVNNRRFSITCRGFLEED